MITKIENFLRNSKFIQKIYNYAPLPLAGAILNLRAIPLVKLRYSEKTFVYLDKLMERDQWTYNKLIDFVEEQLTNIINISKGIPYYKEYAEKAETINDFPILGRDEVKEHYLSLINPQCKSPIKLFTSGSSGSGLPVFYDRETYLHNWAYAMKHFMWAGVNPRDWRISFFGSRVISTERNNPPFWIRNHFEHQYMVSIFHISEKNAGHYVNFLEKHQGLVLEGFPTVLYLVAQYVKTLKGKLEFKAVFSTGEPLYPFMRKEIEEAFGAKAYDSYGMTECAGMIKECDQGGYHVLLDCGYLEVLKENLEPASSGEEGYLVWTGFANSSMPFIRYRIGDRGMWESGTCTCGRPYPLVKPTITRDSDYLVTRSGKLLSPRAINQVLKDKVSFKACQFIQKEKDDIVVRIVPNKSNDFRRELDEVKKNLKEIICEDVHIEEEIADEPIRRGSQGKIPLIISKITFPNIEKP